MSASSAVGTWLTDHGRALLGTAGQLARNPLSTALTVAVVGVALALPFALYLVVDGLSELADRRDRDAELSVFLAPAVSDRGAHALAEELGGHPAIASVRVLERADVLAEFQSLSGLDGIGDAFGGDNPLPAVLLLSGRGRLSDPATRAGLEALAAELSAHPSVDAIEFDAEWLSRIHALLSVLTRAVTVLAVLLAAGLLLAVGNVVRVMVERRREEVEVARLCGASDAFIRRPFLYSGALLGVLGAVLGWCVLLLGRLALEGPLTALSTFYPGVGEPTGPGLRVLTAIVLAGASIGWAGAWLAAGRELRSMEP